MTGPERLKVLADWLESDAVPDARFDMRDWEMGCGTAYCAAGWAAQCPELAAEGLRMSEGNPTFVGRWSWSAVSEFFALPAFDTNHLFDPCCYDSYGTTTKAEVVARIRAHIAAQEARP